MYFRVREWIIKRSYIKGVWFQSNFSRSSYSSFRPETLLVNLRLFQWHFGENIKIMIYLIKTFHSWSYFSTFQIKDMPVGSLAKTAGIAIGTVAATYATVKSALPSKSDSCNPFSAGTRGVPSARSPLMVSLSGIRTLLLSKSSCWKIVFTFSRRFSTESEDENQRIRKQMDDFESVI